MTTPVRGGARRGAGRPTHASKGLVKLHPITVFVSPRHRALLTVLAAHQGTSMNAILRQLLEAAATKRLR